MYTIPLAVQFSVRCFSYQAKIGIVVRIVQVNTLFFRCTPMTSHNDMETKTGSELIRAKHKSYFALLLVS